MATWKKQFTVTAAGLNISIATVQDFNFRALSINGPYMAVDNGIDATAGDFDPNFIALSPQKLRGTGERTGDPGDTRIVPIRGAVGLVAALRVPLGAPDAIIEVSSPSPF